MNGNPVAGDGKKPFTLVAIKLGYNFYTGQHGSVPKNQIISKVMLNAAVAIKT
jgi:hypothetical protein